MPCASNQGISPQSYLPPYILDAGHLVVTPSHYGLGTVLAAMLFSTVASLSQRIRQLVRSLNGVRVAYLTGTVSRFERHPVFTGSQGLTWASD